MTRLKGSKNVPKFKVTMLANGKDYSAKGKTLLEALTKLKCEPVRIGVAIIRVEYGGKVIEKVVGKIKTVQLFNRDGSPTMRKIAQLQMAKYLEPALQGSL